MVKKKETHTIDIDEKDEEEEDPKMGYGCMKCIGIFLVSLICCILAVGYYVIVVELCIFTVEQLELKLTILVSLHLLYSLCVWCFLRTIMSRPATPPARFALSESDKKLYLSEERAEKKQEILVRAAKALSIYTRDKKGNVRYCETCQVLKPDRCHHCPVCDVCVLKMDHHCVFLNNCVGFSNYKFFLLSVTYGLMLCIITSALSLYYLVLFWNNQLPDTDSKAPIFFHWCMSTILALMFAPFLYSHFNLAANNVTAISDDSDEEESHGGSFTYDLGLGTNMRQIFGDKKIYWFFPIFSSLGDGASFSRGDAADLEKNASFDY